MRQYGIAEGLSWADVLDRARYQDVDKIEEERGER